MYIMIHESGDMVLLKELTKEDLRAADDGYVELLDVSRADEPLRYMDEGWTDIDVPNVQQYGASTTQETTNETGTNPAGAQSRAGEAGANLSGWLAAERPEYNSIVAGQLLCIRDALVAEDYDEAYHLLYLIADQNLSSLEPWAEMERIAKAAN